MRSLESPLSPVSVLIITRNERSNIGDCLRSLASCDQIVVVDSGSTDNTQALARAAGAEVVERPFQGFADQKNWAIESIDWRNEWLLFLDADERVTPQLDRSIRRVVSGAGEHDGYFVDRQFQFCGHTFRHSGLSPNWHLRLVRRSWAHFENRQVDERLIPPRLTGQLRGKLLHNDQRGVAAWVDRHNLYSNIDAHLRLAEGPPGELDVTLHQALHDSSLRRRWLKKRVWPWVPAKPLAIFLYMYVARLGVLDGRAGLRYASLRAFYELLTQLKIEEGHAATATRDHAGASPSETAVQ